MAEEEQVIEQKQENKPEQEDVKKAETAEKRSFDSYLREELTKGKEKPIEKQPEPIKEGEPEEEEKEGEKGEKKGKLSTSEYIRKLKSDKKELAAEVEAKETAITELQNTTKTLEEKLNKITEQLEKGNISEKEAEKRTRKAEKEFNLSLEDIELSEDLEPFKHDIAKLAHMLAAEQIKPLKEQLDNLLKEKEEEKKSHEEEKQQKFVNNVLDTYSQTAKKYPDLFDGIHEDGFPKMKPEYETKAMEMFDTLNLTTEKGIELLFDYLQRDAKKAETVQKKVEKFETLKKSQVDSADQRSIPEKPKPKPLKAYFEEAFAKT